VERSREEHEAILSNIINTLTEKMVSHGFSSTSFDISGRSKHIYSIYKKMRTPKYEGKGVERIYDKLGVRVILRSVQDCYTMLGLIHSEWPPIPGEFDDYIGMRLPSGYQSLHTSVKYGPGKNDIVEFQIRTEQMDFDAEYGVAAHWKYKEKDSSRRDRVADKALERKIAWLRQMVDEPQQEDPESFVALLKADVLQDLVYVFTPKGDIIELSIGSTPIDYAYHIHTDIGHRCRGSKVNGKLVPLDYVLKTGDQVEILTTRQGGPSRDWLNPNLGLVKTQRARAKLRQWFKRQAKDQNVNQGKAMLDKELRRLGLSDVNLDRLSKEFDQRNIEQFYEAIGCGDLPIGRLVNHLTLAEKEESSRDHATLSRPSHEHGVLGAETVSVLGLKGILTSMGRCCNPAPGDAIVGYITRGRGATIHRQDCPNMLRVEDRERLVRVSWGEVKRTYPVPVRLKAYDRNGLMKDISTLISDEGLNMTDIKVNVAKNLAILDLILEVPDIAKLSRVLDRLENLPNVMEARRIQPG
jgi:GTP pyrophosphokinase